jgi:aspartate/methionine/tyrosine aminotransferase
MYVTFALAGAANSDEACRRILEEARVGLAPGWLFGASSTSFIRMCIFRETRDIEEACRRIAHALGRGHGSAGLARAASAPG